MDDTQYRMFLAQTQFYQQFVAMQAGAAAVVPERSPANVELNRNCLVAQYQFLNIFQSGSITAFAAALRADIPDCKFENTCSCECNCRTPNDPADLFLRAQFIRGLRSNAIREQLLQGTPGTFSETVSKALALEAASLDITGLNKSQPPPVHKISKKDLKAQQRGRSTQPDPSQQNVRFRGLSPRSKVRVVLKELGLEKVCLCCGKSGHNTSQCFMYWVKCWACRKVGHIQKVCISTLFQKER